MKQKWPPLITRTNVPWWISLRNFVLTLMAWGVLIYFMWPLLAVTWQLLQDVLMHQDSALRRDERIFWNEVYPFFQIVGLLAVWLVLFAIVRRRYLASARKVAEQPEPLPLETQAADFGVDVDDLRRMQSAARAVVHFTEHGRIEGVEVLEGEGSHSEEQDPKS